jgi:hypothetical protein
MSDLRNHFCEFTNINLILNDIISIYQVTPLKSNFDKKIIIIIDNCINHDFLNKLACQLSVDVAAFIPLVQTLKTVVKYYQKHFKEIILVGKSLGINYIEFFLDQTPLWDFPILFLCEKDQQNSIICTIGELLKLPLITSVSPNPSSSGALVIIKGYNLKNDYQTKVNLIPCEFFSEIPIEPSTEDILKITLPENYYGHFYLNYIYADQCSKWIPVYIDTHYFPSIPTISSFDSYRGTQNSKIIITGTRLTNVTNLFLYKIESPTNISQIDTYYLPKNSTDATFSLENIGAEVPKGVYFICLKFDGNILGLDNKLTFEIV